jgi:TATA-binding protein-associated factor
MSFEVTLPFSRRLFDACLTHPIGHISCSCSYSRTIAFNYCVLDEGHVIRNPKTKLSKAIRQISAGNNIRSDTMNNKRLCSICFVVHRLILSGTPIQNNALELWILFDFLMPGYLGSEKQFIRRYQKPLTASSRDRDLEHGI